MRIVQVTQPSEEPIDLNDLAKISIRASGTQEDALLSVYIQAARIYCEGRTSLRFVTQQVDMYLDHWGQCVAPLGWGYSLTGTTLYNDAYRNDRILLPYGPVQGVDSISYIDASGSSEEWAETEYIVSEGMVGRIAPKQGRYFPTTADQIDCIKISMTLGYGTADDVPAPIKHAMLLYVGEANRLRTGSSPLPLKAIPIDIDNILASVCVGGQYTL